MDGLAKSNDLVFLLAASNLPWELDLAMLRRLEKRVLVPLPGPSARKAMIAKLIAPYAKEELNLDHVVEKTEVEISSRIYSLLSCGGLVRFCIFIWDVGILRR